MIRKITLFFILSAMIVACSKNALTGKKQLTLLPESELQNMAVQEYQSFLSANNTGGDAQHRTRIRPAHSA